jgi:hypothetical protein
MKLKAIFFFLILGNIHEALRSQTSPFQILLEPLSITGLSGIQAYAFGQYNGKWLIVGGRLDGLHRRQPFASFDVAGRNDQLTVIDPLMKQMWSAPLTSLSVGLQDQLSSTNMEFIQEGDYLYLIGGYGYSYASKSHITYPNLTAIKLPEVINAIINKSPIHTFFRQIMDERFAVTGGYLNKIYNTYYLTGGQRFDGRYNPMGPDHGPGFSQVYTNAIRKFRIKEDGVKWTITHLPSVIDGVNLHRRDYNVVPQIMPNRQEGLTAFSGVFQVTIELPYLNSVNIDSAGYIVNNDFKQYYNHYHCAHIPLYSFKENKMHTVFFGGIAQYYDSAGVLIQDNNVPFVKTIARVTRDEKGVMSEYKLPVEMPALLGAGSEFIPVEKLPKYNNEVIKLDELNDDTTLVGYIYGGISSVAMNVFFSNSGTQSSATNRIFKVYVIKKKVSVNLSSEGAKSLLPMQVFPNPNDGSFVLKFNLQMPSDVKLSIYDLSSQILETTILKNMNAGENTLNRSIKKGTSTGIYFISLETASEKATHKISINP